ncbi:uncharacterized protein LOC133839332 [Drosophila sulfurigaster albostrigata]|uniref:uncharacterized protein LOC133839332 n=1 Tax=Drosophila sulfurigaster albostrigata TaxID=89887 RepID=UPI002D21E4B3|nr:uncharacterized protein LOC133839332 [Drosophila sulfurigaster albostrigata]
MLRSYFCDYNVMPLNYNTWMSPQYSERFQRVDDGETTLGITRDKRPMLIVLHLFAENVSYLQHWLDMVYKLSAKELYGEKIAFFVDDLWSTHVFGWDGYVCRSENYPMESPPLIYGKDAAGKVHFFGSNKEPKTPSLESLGEFCKQFLEGSLIAPVEYKEKIPVPDIDLVNFNEIVYGQDEMDILICLYSSQKLGTPDTDKFLRDLESLAGKLQQEQVQIWKMNVQNESPPKKFQIESTPAVFMLPRTQKHKPIRCFDTSRGIYTLIKFVAEHSSEELLYYDRRGFPKVHGHLLQHITYSFNEINK